MSDRVNLRLGALIIQEYQSMLLRAGRYPQSPVVDSAIKKNFSVRRSRSNGYPDTLRVGFLVSLPEDPKSTLPHVFLDMIPGMLDAQAIIFYVPTQKEKIAKKNPKLMEKIRSIETAKVQFIFVNDDHPYDIGHAISADIAQKNISAMCFNFQIGIFRLVAAMCDVPLILGIDHGNPQWYSSASLDICLTGNPHCSMECLTESILLPKVMQAPTKRKSVECQVIRSRFMNSESGVLAVTSGTQAKFRSLDTWKILIKIAKLPDVEVVVVGITSANIPRKLASSIKGNIHLVGYQSNFDDFAAAADVYIDTFPIAGGEAISRTAWSGVPCVLWPPRYDGLFDKRANLYSAKAEAFRGSPGMAEEPSVQSIVNRAVELIGSAELRAETVKFQNRVLEGADTITDRGYRVCKIIRERLRNRAGLCQKD
jgi:hypothetical protein